jgi:hypothetical protein
MKRAASDKNDEGIELVLHVPESARNRSDEPVIKERLAAHFKRHLGLLQREKKSVLNRGISMVILGVIAMVAATFILFHDSGDSLLFSFLVVFLEPAAWFLLWEGMDQIIFSSKNIDPELNFYRKMSGERAEVTFEEY